MAFNLSDLLNPAPASAMATPGAVEEDGGAGASVPPVASEAFAPELFQSVDNVPLAEDQLAAMAMDAATALEATDRGEMLGDIHDIGMMPHLKRETTDDMNGLDTSAYPLDGFIGSGSGVLAPPNLREIDDRSPSVEKSKTAGHKYKKHGSPEDARDKEPKSTKHSSKNEGQHTDRRYLCYICNKLFTRRRSVRDHISKIHNTKTWEPVRSLEIIVDPDTGEPTEPLEDIIARGPPPPPPKPDKAQKAEKHATVESEDPPQADSAPPEPERHETPEAPPALPTVVAALKTEPSVAGSRASSVDPFSTPAPVIGKKRPAPDSGKPPSSAATKKGMAKVKSSSTPNKRPKLAETESASEKGTPLFRSPSATPASAQRTPSSKLKKQTAMSAATSPTPTSSRAASMELASPSPSSTGTPGSSNDDGEIFCICRKGDNHTWMIACDGGCDEWFHGNCVNIRERDGDLIDKYVCPNCKKEGFQTTWKRMCRRKGCRKPAKVLQIPPSKYCSKDCGRMFFVELVRRGDPNIDTMKNQYVVEGGRVRKTRPKRRRADKVGKVSKVTSMMNGDIGESIHSDSRLATPAYSEEEKTEYETDSSADDDQLPNRGGALRAGEVKAIIDKCKTIEQWRDLGRKPATPPREADDVDDTEKKPIIYDDFEQEELDEVRKRTSELNWRNEILDAREKVLELVKARSSNITDEVKKSNPKMKDPCGFDPRLAWSEEEFLLWYNGEGKSVLDSGKIGPPDEDGRMQNGHGSTGNDTGESDSDDEEEKMPKKGGVCVRNRCPRHRNWAKGQLAELRFEQDVIRRKLRRCEEQEREIRDRAIVKAWEARSNKVERWCRS